MLVFLLIMLVRVYFFNLFRTSKSNEDFYLKQTY